MSITDPERPEFEEGEEMCDFIVRLLAFCGECVKLGYMKPFTILHSDIKLVKANLNSSPAKQTMLDSYNRYVNNIRKVNLFNGADNGT